MHTSKNTAKDDGIGSAFLFPAGGQQGITDAKHRWVSGQLQVTPEPEHDPVYPSEEAAIFSAKLHCLYGVPFMHYSYVSSPTQGHQFLSWPTELHPYARSRVYDLRQHTADTFWGPFRDDGSQDVDWHKIEALMINLWYNIDRYSAKHLARTKIAIIVPPWYEPFAGVTPHTQVPLPPRDSSSVIETPLALPLEMQDPYGITGVWMRVVCFLDYRELFTFNFSDDQPAPGDPRPPLDTDEAIRFIALELEVTRITEPGRDDGQGLPVVHFKGASNSLLPPVDPNANSKIRGSVRLTPEGEVRWTTFSVFHGEERWRSEGIQVGGVRAARGVLGFWFDKDFDEYGPAGPTAFWKVNNDGLNEMLNAL